LRDFMNDSVIGQLGADAQEFAIAAGPGDAVMLKLVPLK
jgi:hypothetical protein